MGYHQTRIICNGQFWNLAYWKSDSLLYCNIFHTHLTYQVMNKCSKSIWYRYNEVFYVKHVNTQSWLINSLIVTWPSVMVHTDSKYHIERSIFSNILITGPYLYIIYNPSVAKSKYVTLIRRLIWSHMISPVYPCMKIDAHFICKKWKMTHTMVCPSPSLLFW